MPWWYLFENKKESKIIDMKKIRNIFILLAAATVVIACNNKLEENNIPSVGEASQVIFTVGGVDQTVTKSATSKPRCTQTDRIALSEPGDPCQVFLVETVENLDDTYYATEADTKGTPVYTETFSSTYGTFSTVPYRGTAKLTSGVKSNSAGLIPGSQNRYAFDFTDGWPGTDDILFFMAAPANLEQASNTTYGYSNLKLNATASNGTFSFDYAAPSGSYDNGATAGDATKLNDLLFTSKIVSKSMYDGDGATVLFYHTMAGVKFKSGNAVREGTKNAKINSKNVTDAKITRISKITLTNIVSNGSCTVTPDQSYSNTNSNATASVPKSSSATKWTAATSPAYHNYSVVFEGLASNDGKFVESTGFEGGNDLGQYNINDSDFKHTFMFVPQTTKADEKSTNVVKNSQKVVLTIEYTIGEKKFRKSVDFTGRTWEAGKLYTYTLTANHVGVSVIDELSNDGQTKENVVITNTGNIPEYIRAAIVGNWFDNHSSITGYNQFVAPWGGPDAASEGIIEWAENATTNAPWIKGEDGYWYYPEPVDAQAEVPTPLFYTYKQGVCPKAMYQGKSHLELEIIVQAVDASRISEMKTYWPGMPESIGGTTK